jgi:hypothetical protein
MNDGLVFEEKQRAFRLKTELVKIPKKILMNAIRSPRRGGAHIDAS